jgi:hypothetical protein
MFVLLCEGVVEFISRTPEEPNAQLPGRLGAAVEVLWPEFQVLKKVPGKAAVVPSPTPMTPMSGLRTTRTRISGSFSSV